MPESKSDLAELERAVRSAEDEVFRIQMADNFAFTNGNFDRAVRVLASARRELADAQVAHIKQQCAEIIAAGERMMAAAGLAMADTSDASS